MKLWYFHQLPVGGLIVLGDSYIAVCRIQLIFSVSDLKKIQNDFELLKLRLIDNWV